MNPLLPPPHSRNGGSLASISITWEYNKWRPNDGLHYGEAYSPSVSAAGLVWGTTNLLVVLQEKIKTPNVEQSKVNKTTAENTLQLNNNTAEKQQYLSGKGPSPQGSYADKTWYMFLLLTKRKRIATAEGDSIFLCSDLQLQRNSKQSTKLPNSYLL